MKMNQREFLRAMREDLVGLEVDYCFHLHTPPEARRQFTIKAVQLDGDYINLIGDDRMITLMGLSAIGYIREGDSWIKEGILYQHAGEELRIGTWLWTHFFQTGGRVYVPW